MLPIYNIHNIPSGGLSVEWDISRLSLIISSPLSRIAYRDSLSACVCVCVGLCTGKRVCGVASQCVNVLTSLFQRARRPSFSSRGARSLRGARLLALRPRIRPPQLLNKDESNNSPYSPRRPCVCAQCPTANDVYDRPVLFHILAVQVRARAFCATIQKSPRVFIIIIIIVIYISFLICCGRE